MLSSTFFPLSVMVTSYSLADPLSDYSCDHDEKL